MSRTLRGIPQHTSTRETPNIAEAETNIEVCGDEKGKKQQRMK